MPRVQPPLFPATAKLLADFGERIRLARLRRDFSMETVAARAQISRITLSRAERGDPAVAFGTYLRILQVLRLEQDVALLAKDDAVGRKLQDLKLPERRRASKRPAKAKSDNPIEGGER